MQKYHQIKEFVRSNTVKKKAKQHPQPQPDLERIRNEMRGDTTGIQKKKLAAITDLT